MVRPNSAWRYGHDRRGQAAVGEVVRGEWEVRGAHPELEREVQRGGRLPAARDADQDHLRLGKVAGRRAVVVRLCEVDRLHPGVVLARVGDAVRASRRVGTPRPQLALERRDEDLEQVERECMGAVADALAGALVDDRAEHERPLALPRGGRVDLADRVVDLFGGVHERQGVPDEVELVELHEQAVAQHLGGDAGAVRDKKYGAAIGHGLCRPRYQRFQTGSTPNGRGGRSPRSSQLSPGPW